MGIPNHYLLGSSPRPWGCFWSSRRQRCVGCVFPTPVGVFPIEATRQVGMVRLPHARGGVSGGLCCCHHGVWSSPRPWGCFCPRRPANGMRLVFPTPVGVFPLACQQVALDQSLPHARGGVSATIAHVHREAESSPRPWGCFPLPRPAQQAQRVFPTPVGVFLSGAASCIRSRSLPHARGGVS